MAGGQGLMAGKRGLILGVANNRSIAWGIAKACADQGAEIALTYQGEAFKKRVEPLAAELGAHVAGHCDVTDPASLDAVFAANDLMAAGALRVLKSMGRKVPDDVALVGFDDSHVARHTDPQLTSVRQPIEDLGRNMARLILQRLRDSTAIPAPVVLPTELVFRESA